MSRAEEIKAELIKITEQGVEAAQSSNLQGCLDAHAKAAPLMRELAQLTGDEYWSDKAKQGDKLAEFTRLML